MATRTSKLPRKDQERRQSLEELNAEHGPDWAEQYKPGSFGCHELLDRTMLVAEMVEQQLLEHPSCVLNREWYALADKAVATAETAPVGCRIRFARQR